MSIWFKHYDLDDVKKITEKNMLHHIGIEFIEIGNDFIKAKMPVDHRTMQPYGLLHGGASCVLAESLGSIASNLCLDRDKKYGVGIEINANHIKSITKGNVIG
ncbi:MAG: hotdog fold thioesterase, partial [Proteobacteria bacterium]|nr:hotdog fold thioesterase [Pseudomonadota bacterium]